MVKHLQTRISALFTRYMFLGTLAAIIVLVAPDPARAQARKIDLGDLQKTVNVSSPVISPDGKSIVIVVSRVNWDEDRYDSQLVLVDIATGAQRPLTNIRKGLDSPQWSPSGDRLAFLSEAGEEKKTAAQIFVLPMNGGEAKQITSLPLGVEQFAWRPDGGFIAFASPDEPPNKADIEKHHDLFEVGDNSFLDASAPTPSHLWLIPASGGTAERLTSGAWSLSKDEDNIVSSLSWSPDGKRICFTRQADPHVGDSDQTVIEILDVDSGQIRQLTKRSSFEGFGLFSPDGSKIAYSFPRDGDFNNENEIFVAPSAGGEGSDISRALDRNVSGAIWMPDGKSLLVSGDDGTRTVIWIQPLDGAARKVDLGEVDPTLDAFVFANVGKDGSIAFAGCTPAQPAELYYLASPDAKPKRLTDFNHEIATLDLGRTDTFEWKGPDGFAEDGVVVYPPNFSHDRRYPLVLLIHGGPTGSSTTVFTDFGLHVFIAQLMASHGYVVFEPNYRGSDNLGNKYQLAIVNDAGDGPGRDIIAGISALEKQGFIDESRIGVSGWSYGGYLTSWLISHYHVWKAAVSGAAANRRADAYNLSDYGVKWRFMFGGSPWKKQYAKAYEDQSPITYAAAITTPTLILHDTGDRRVPITNAYALYHALKDNGVTVKFIAVPVAAHFPYGNPVHESDIYRVWLEWFDQYLK
jgi:dipeptidyl aminopeptidase/acylaminoacyl peptidase